MNDEEKRSTENKLVDAALIISIIFIFSLVVGFISYGYGQHFGRTEVCQQVVGKQYEVIDNMCYRKTGTGFDRVFQ